MMFVEDLESRGMLQGITIRSPVAGRRFEGIEVRDLPPPWLLVTARDLPGDNRLAGLEVPVFTPEGGLLAYKGEPVGLLLGPDETKLEDYASRCVVRFSADSESGALFTPGEEILRLSFTGGAQAGAAEERKEKEEKTENVEKYTTAIEEHGYAEPAGALAVAAGGRVTIHTATQWPLHVRKSVAGALGLELDQVTVECTRLGIHLDGKVWYPSLIACQAAAGALAAGKPVKLMLTRDEDFRYSPKRHATEIRIRTALDEGGEPAATVVEAEANLGAHPVFSREILSRVALGCRGVYRLGAVRVTCLGRKTPLPPQGPFAGFGMAQGFFVLERHVSRLADRLRVDPAEWRKRHCLGKGDDLGLAPGLSIPLTEAPPLPELIDAAAAAGDYYRKWASYELLRRKNREAPAGWGESLRGIGIACAYQGADFLLPDPIAPRSGYGLEVTLEKDGSLEIRAAEASLAGESVLRIWRALAREILAVEEDKVKLVTTGEDLPDPGPAVLSRDLAVLSRLVERCCYAIRKQRFRDPLPIRVRRMQRPPRQSRKGEAGVFPYPAWGAAVVEVAIDAESFQPQVRGVYLAVEGGRILSPVEAEGALRLGCLHALGWASRPAPAYRDGLITGEVALPSPAEAPPLQVLFYPAPDPDPGAGASGGSSGGAVPKGIGDLPYSCVPAAYVQAVSQALDYPFEKLPVHAQDVWEIFYQKDKKTPGSGPERAGGETP